MSLRKRSVGIKRLQELVETDPVCRPLLRTYVTEYKRELVEKQMEQATKVARRLLEARRA